MQRRFADSGGEPLRDAYIRCCYGVASGGLDSEGSGVGGQKLKLDEYLCAQASSKKAKPMNLRPPITMKDASQLAPRGELCMANVVSPSFIIGVALVINVDSCKTQMYLELGS
ncbi:hypothetical protein V6N11_021571 [Hibiscus sabdariffa]|uniref:Uncharacterized protein n=1 Tax=Hibiscus sabdariffa TaxID=183260 RepID=A0ABR2A016_9ROSI